MNEIFEIAYAAEIGQLCFFTGTGFSKAVTENKAPGWQELLKQICDKTDNPENIKNSLFPQDGKNPLNLEEAAQVISIELLQANKKIHEEIAGEIRKLLPSGDNREVSKFFSKYSFQVVTTNYDKLAESLVGEKDCHSLTPGRPIPRSPARVKIYHVHGSIDSPVNMVVTSEDYFNFINSENYFSKKLSVLLHENTVVIIGYSLNDNNLKAILNDYKGFTRNIVIGSNIILVSRSKVVQQIKDYYYDCYGIRVLDNLSVEDFFADLNLEMPNAKKCVDLIESTKKVMIGNEIFTNEYLSLENSFIEIVTSLSAVGHSIKEPLVVILIGKIIQAKTELSKQIGAWSQYTHLAKWLIHLASILELNGTSIEDVYLDATLRSMTTMKPNVKGYSWHAYNVWSNDWNKMISSNKSLIRKYIQEKTDWPEALEIVNRK